MIDQLWWAGEEGELSSSRVCDLSPVVTSSPLAYRRSLDLCAIFPCQSLLCFDTFVAHIE